MVLAALLWEPGQFRSATPTRREPSQQQLGGFFVPRSGNSASILKSGVVPTASVVTMKSARAFSRDRHLSFVLAAFVCFGVLFASGIWLSRHSGVAPQLRAPAESRARGQLKPSSHRRHSRHARRAASHVVEPRLV